MSALITREATAMNRLLPWTLAAAALWVTALVHAAAPGITGPAFTLTAHDATLVPARTPGGGKLETIEDAPGSYVKVRD